MGYWGQSTELASGPDRLCFTCYTGLWYNNRYLKLCGCAIASDDSGCSSTSAAPTEHVGTQARPCSYKSPFTKTGLALPTPALCGRWSTIQNTIVSELQCITRGQVCNRLISHAQRVWGDGREMKAKTRFLKLQRWPLLERKTGHRLSKTRLGKIFCFNKDRKRKNKSNQQQQSQKAQHKNQTKWSVTVSGNWLNPH